MMSQRKSAAPGAGDRASVDRESGPAPGFEKFTSAILTYLGFKVTKLSSADETLDRFARGDVSSGLKKPEMAARAANLLTVRLSSGISANILDFRIPQKHVLRVMPAWKPAAGVVANGGQTYQSAPQARPERAARLRTHRAGRAGSDGGKQENEIEIRNPARGESDSDKDRAARLADPGFGRVFTDHMAIVRYDQANGWHGARIEARANFPLDPATAVLHYAQEIFEGLKAYKRDDGGVNLFRPDANARRFRDSAERMAMAPLPECVFIEAVEQIIRIDRAWIPGGEGSLYFARS